MKFFRQRTTALTSVSNNVTLDTSRKRSKYGSRQVTIATFDSAGNSVTATGGTFAIKYKGGPEAQPEVLQNDSGSDLSIDATSLRSVLFDGNCEEVTVVPDSIAGAAQYRVILTEGE